MNVKFAFSTVCCPTWDFEAIVAKAKEYGYGGVEVRGFVSESVLTAANVFLTDPAKVKRIFAEGGIQIACLASSVAMKGDKKADARAADELRQFITTAEAIGCPLVKLFDTQVKPGQARAAAAVAMGHWLLPLGDFAAEHGVQLVIENALSFRDAKEMWMMLETINHPCVAAAWDVFNAALVGESPSISVPTLNSRIQYVQVKDAQLGPMGATLCPMGEGDVKVKRFLHLLRGIGYDGWVTFEWEKAWLPNIAGPEEALPAAIAKLKEWGEEPVKEEPKKHVKA
jgi:sugar phosphate isomerase/epimerase